MSWIVEVVPEVADWLGQCSSKTHIAVMAALEALEVEGPALGRPIVDTISGSRHRNMKELRPTRSIRLLFAFDPRRHAVVLVAGDKQNDWTGWYLRNIPIADQRFDAHLDSLGRKSNG